MRSSTRWLSAQGYDIELIFVDDGSTDGSWQVIRRIAERDSRVRGLRFRRNFGKASALSAGFDAARGELVMTLDADLQDDPREIPRFLEAISDKLDVVSGWKKIRHDPWHKVWPSRVFNWAVSLLTGVRLHDHNCGMKCYRPRDFSRSPAVWRTASFRAGVGRGPGISSGRDRDPTSPAPIRPIEVRRAAILPTGVSDLLTVKFLTGFGQRPQHLLGAIGLGSFSVGADRFDAYCGNLLGIQRTLCINCLPYFILSRRCCWGDN